jgi:hypothetical protein
MDMIVLIKDNSRLNEVKNCLDSFVGIPKRRLIVPPTVVAVLLANSKAIYTARQ